MDNLAIKEFKRDFTIQTIVHQKQFEQWLKFLFYLNDRLQKKYDIVYQESFYVKIYEVLTTGLKYAQDVYNCLLKGENVKKTDWYSVFIDGFKTIKKTLNESEFLYIEYRRHIASHMFQNKYEHIQEDLRIKKKRNNQDLVEINKILKRLLILHGSDKNLDIHLNNKLQPILTGLYHKLTK